MGASSIMVYLPDSVELAYTKLLAGLTQAGYPIPKLSHKADGQAAAFSTEPKTIANVAGLALQVVVDPITPGNAGLFLGILGKQAQNDGQGQTAPGSVVTFMGKYVPVNSQGQAERDTRKWRWIHYGVADNTLPTQAFWEDMNRVAIESFPGARVVYF